MTGLPLYILFLLEGSRQLFFVGTAAMVMFTALLYWLSKYVMHQQLQAKMQEMCIRNRIAGNLHDELGSLLMLIQLQTEALLIQPNENQARLERLLDTARSACSAMRDVAWGLDAEADTVNALEDRMRDLLDQLAPSTVLHIHFVVEGLEHVATLPARLRQEMYLVFKEATTNSVRHAQGATCLAVRLFRQKDTIVLEVQDDGAPTTLSNQNGMGLRNMRRRACAVGGALAAAPRTDGPGFQVAFYAPLPRPTPLKWSFWA